MNIILSSIRLVIVHFLKKAGLDFIYFKPVKVGVNYSDGEKCGCGSGSCTGECDCCK